MAKVMAFVPLSYKKHRFRILSGLHADWLTCNKNDLVFLLDCILTAKKVCAILYLTVK